MSNSLLLNGPSGFRFVRPSIGRIGSTDLLHPYVETALEELVARLDLGFTAPEVGAREQVEELEAMAQGLDRRAREAERLSDRGARDVDEAYEEHRKAEDVAERRAAEYEEARQASSSGSGTSSSSGGAGTAEAKKGKGGGYEDGPPDPEALKKKRDEARKAAEKAAEALEEVKSRAAKHEKTADTARREADKAAQRALEARAKLRKAQDEVATQLKLPIYSRDPAAKTLLSQRPPNGAVSLSELIDRFGFTAELYEVRGLIDRNKKRLEFNLRNMIAHHEIVDYLFARAIFAEGFDEPEGIFNFIVSADRGERLLYTFVTERALVLMRDEQRLNVPEDSMTAMIERLREDRVLLRRDPFDRTLRLLQAEFVYGDSELALVLEAERVLGIDIPGRFQPPLVDYIRRSNADETRINKQNAPYFVSIALAKLQKEEVSLAPAGFGPEVGVEDYSVSYYEDRITAPEYERASIEAAAQMYLTMVWGDMLGIFPAVDRIAMQSASQGQAPILLEVRSRELSDDLRMYVLDEEFRDLKTGQIRRRVAPQERQMFYRQLFGIGDAQVVEEQHVNPDFQRYWAVLMMEAVKYIGKVEENGDNYSSISASKVYQAIEDLQYNLSAYCTGLPKIAAPTMYGELDFVIQRILDSDDVKQQLGRRGAPSFWKVVEQIRGMQDFTPLRNKGMYGHKIISTVASATPALVEDQSAFEEFIAAVEAYIVAEDQLAEAGGSMAGLQFPGFFGFDSPGLGAGPGYSGTPTGHVPGMPSGLPGMPSGLPGMPGNMFGSPRPNGQGATGANGGGSQSAAEDWNF